MTGATSNGAVTELSQRQETRGVEEDLFSLNAMVPELLEHVPVLFEETVRDSLNYMLGTKESTGVISWFRGDELACRQGVFARLSAVYGEKASPLQIMIDRVFGMRVHELVRQLP